MHSHSHFHFTPVPSLVVSPCKLSSPPSSAIHFSVLLSTGAFQSVPVSYPNLWVTAFQKTFFFFHRLIFYLLELPICIKMMLIKWSTTAACRLLAVTTVALLFSLVGISEAITPAELKWPSCDINGLQYTVNDCLNKLDNNLKKMRINEGNNSLVRVRLQNTAYQYIET